MTAPSAGEASIANVLHKGAMRGLNQRFRVTMEKFIGYCSLYVIITDMLWCIVMFVTLMI